MTTRHITACMLTVLVIIVADLAAAQTVQVSGDYQTARVPAQTLAVGWGADVALNVQPLWSVVAEVSGAYRTEEQGTLGVDVHLSLHTFGAGARWSLAGSNRIAPFIQLLAGAASARARTEILGAAVSNSSVRFMLQPGGGVLFKVSKVLGFVGQVDYRRLFADREDSAASGENQFRAMVGARFNL